MNDDALVTVRNVTKSFKVSGALFDSPRFLHALNGVSLEVSRGEVLSIVGESGCGKSTIGRIIMGLLPATSGEVTFDGRRIDNLTNAAMRPLRQHMQTIFQDPFNSLNPRMRVGDIIAEPLRNFRADLSASDVRDRVQELIDRVRLPIDSASRWPHEFSGGQRQRICIARALASNPKFIVCDEPVSALDVSIKAQIVNLLQQLQEEFNIGLLFISHDLSIVEHISHRVAVMYMGRIVETGTCEEIFSRPQHPYTMALFSAVPRQVIGGARNRIILKGDVPSPLNLPTGCSFQSRCPRVFDRCKVESPVLRRESDEHSYACHLDSSIFIERERANEIQSCRQPSS